MEVTILATGLFKTLHTLSLSDAKSDRTFSLLCDRPQANRLLIEWVHEAKLSIGN